MRCRVAGLSVQSRMRLNFGLLNSGVEELAAKREGVKGRSSALMMMEELIL